MQQHLDAGNFTLNLAKSADSSNPDDDDDGGGKPGETDAPTSTSASSSSSSTSLPASTTAATQAGASNGTSSSATASLPPVSASTRGLIIAHGVLLSLGFLVALPLAVLIARYTRLLTSRWLNLHRFIAFVAGAPLIVLGWIIGPVAVAQQGGKHFNDAHKVL